MVVLVLAPFSCTTGDGAARDEMDGRSGAETDADPGHGDAGPGDGGPADAAGEDAAIEDAGSVEDAGPHEDAGTADDAGTTGPRIDSVLIDGAFTQVRQGVEFDMVITGSELGGVTDIQFADGIILYPDTLIVSPTQVSARMFVYGDAPPGPRDVTVVGAGGSATAPAAIEVTPLVFSPTASPGGRGTYDSPMLLADYVTDDVWGGLVLFLAGEHVANTYPIFGGGVTITGEGVEATTVRLLGIDLWPEAPWVAAIRDLTLVGSLSAGGDGSFLIEDVVMIGGTLDLGGPDIDQGFLAVQIQNLSLSGQSADQEALYGTGNLQLSIADSRFASCGRGVRTEYGGLAVADSTFEGCAFAIGAGTGRHDPASQYMNTEVVDCQFIDNEYGVLIYDGTASVTDTAFSDDETSAAPAGVGIFVGTGRVTATNVTMSGLDGAGVDVFGAGFDFDPYLNLEMTGVLIEGGAYGVRVDGYFDSGTVTLRSSTIRDQTAASFSIGALDVPYFDLSGDNQLSVTAGFALEDVRSENVIDPIQAAGLTLNGNTYAGAVEGPASVPPDYRIVERNVIQF
jgi:hypothetical protein